jgi:hypothetical protein
MEIWYTLAVSRNATYKMGFKDEMTRQEAINLGKNYCTENNVIYVGTFNSSNIDEEEEKLKVNA